MSEIGSAERAAAGAPAVGAPAVIAASGAPAGVNGAFELRGVDAGYGQARVLAGVGVAFACGRTHVICGPSGAGKTTLLRVLMGLDAPLAGEVMRPGPVAGAGCEGELRLAAAFQEDRLCEGLTATANIRVPHGHLRAGALASFLRREQEALLAVGLDGVEGRPVRELSGGQRRRVAILRAVLADADAFFFDEPLRGMDEGTVAQLMAYICPLLAGKTVFWVTHNEREADWFYGAQRWDVRDGRVVRR